MPIPNKAIVYTLGVIRSIFFHSFCSRKRFIAVHFKLEKLEMHRSCCLPQKHKVMQKVLYFLHNTSNVVCEFLWMIYYVCMNTKTEWSECSQYNQDQAETRTQLCRGGKGGKFYRTFCPTFEHHLTADTTEISQRGLGSFHWISGVTTRWHLHFRTFPGSNTSV